MKYGLLSVSASHSSLLTLLIAVALASCASVDAGLAKTQEAVQGLVRPSALPATANEGVQKHGIAGTELADVFKRVPTASSGGALTYPRAAVTITYATPTIFRPGSSVSDECVMFNVRLWSSETVSRSFDNLQLCTADRSKGVPYRSLTYWPDQPSLRNTTGAVRTSGPRRPTTNFPTDPKTRSAWFDEPGRGLFFLGSILYQLGYQWDQPGEDRLWIVSVPNA